jgi:hypothetical protein
MSCHIINLYTRGASVELNRRKHEYLHYVISHTKLSLFRSSVGIEII